MDVRRRRPRRVGLNAKGAIAEGRAADLAVFAPDELFTVDAAALEHRHPITPYDGRELTGVVRATYLAGEPVDRDGAARAAAAAGESGGEAGDDGSRSSTRQIGAEAIAVLRPCLDIPRWRDELVDARPYGSVDELVAWAEAAAAPFTAEEVDGALAQHPRIGERPAGGGAEAAMSRAEQAGVDPADAEVAAALADGNRAYEERFGRVFLIRAAGRSARRDPRRAHRAPRPHRRPRRSPSSPTSCARSPCSD